MGSLSSGDGHSHPTRPLCPRSLDAAARLSKSGLTHCRGFQGTSVTNVATGFAVVIQRTGILHTLHAARTQRMRAASVIPLAIAAAELTGTVPDKLNRPEILHVDLFAFDCIDELDRTALEGLIVVRARKGPNDTIVRAFYDLSFAKV